METHHLPVTKQARYCTLGNLNQSVRHVWFACHGYGQLAPYFIRHFETLNDGRHFIVAPEGLSRFYLKGVEGRVGATWMTKEDRETDIQDYVNYLDQLYRQVFDIISREQVKVHLLGFSQGAATISRWIALGDVTLESWILWAGLFPYDLSFEINREKLLNAKTLLVYGNDDPYYDAEKYRERHAIVEREGLTYETIAFEGKHEIPGEELLRVTQAYPDLFD